MGSLFSGYQSFVSRINNGPKEGGKSSMLLFREKRCKSEAKTKSGSKSSFFRTELLLLSFDME